MLDILHYMDHHGMEKAVLLGHSLGGKAVMQFAVSFPVRVEKLIVVDMAPKAYPPHHQGIIHALKSVELKEGESRKDVEAHLLEKGLDLSNVQFLAKSLYWEKPGKLGWRFNLPVLSEQYNDFVGGAIKRGVYSGPTLFIKGARSEYIIEEDRFLISQQFPSYHLVTIPKAGHWVHAENPEDFIKEVQYFLLETKKA